MTTINIRVAIAISIVWIGCDQLGPRTPDIGVDAPAPPVPPDVPAPTSHILPAGSIVPSVADNSELTTQIRINDGLSDSALAANNGVLARTAGKADNVPVMFWSFGSAPLAGNFVVSAPLYVLVESDGAGGWLPLASHPNLIDSIPGDARYSAVRRVVYVPITASYAGELLASIEALAEALERGLVAEPIPAGTWQNVPVVPPDTKLELGGVAEPLAPTEVFGRGYRVTLFPLGGVRGVQPLRNGGVPVGQEARLLSGVATGTPPSLPTSADAQPVFQYGIPAAPPATTFNYTPLVTQLDVRLAAGVAPAAITGDAQLFKRSTTGSITGYLVDAVESYVVTTTVTNRQIQFEEGSP